MPEMLLRTKSELGDCDRHLSACSAFGSEIESYLTQYLLVVLSADIEQEIYRLCEARAAVAGDQALSSYVSGTARKILRSVKKSEIADFAGFFGSEPKRKLNSMVADSEVTAFNNAIVSRHAVAHNQGSQITFQELRKAVGVAEKLLGAFEQCLT